MSAHRVSPARRRRSPQRFASAPFEPDLGSRLRAALAEEHARAPFEMREAREATRRVVMVLRAFAVEAVVVRGGLNVGGAELDHVWTVVDGRVIDVAVPVHDDGFLGALRAYVAGDLDAAEVDARGVALAMDRRVIGEYPAHVGYVGLPVFGSMR